MISYKLKSSASNRLEMRPKMSIVHVFCYIKNSHIRLYILLNLVYYWFIILCGYWAYCNKWNGLRTEMVHSSRVQAGSEVLVRFLCGWSTLSYVCIQTHMGDYQFFRDDLTCSFSFNAVQSVLQFVWN